MELNYDYGFSQNQLNGNIAGMKWRNNGDGAQRAYGFTYDAPNRLLRGDLIKTQGGVHGIRAQALISAPGASHTIITAIYLA